MDFFDTEVCSMVACARRKLLGKNRCAVYHCWNRCVRRAYLCGQDPVTGKDFSHRRDWLLKRQEQFAALFAIEIEFHAEMNNHFHLVLRTRPDVARRWSRHEVARRWLTLTRLAKCMSDSLPTPDPKKIDQLARNKRKIAKLKKRLSKISWFMGLLCENIARRANKEDECGGHFWGTRFRCRECTSASAILLCGIYVDLNPLKAGEVQSIETARYTSIYQRLKARGQRADARNRADRWLGELTWDPRKDRDQRVVLSSRTGHRASDRGLIAVQLEDYLKLLKWTLRQLRSGRIQKIPANIDVVLERLKIDDQAWLETFEAYERAFCHAVGPVRDLAKVAKRMNMDHIKGISAARRVFG